MRNQRRHRDRITVLAEMLETAKDGALKTSIMYGANLNSEKMDDYLPFLLEREFLEAIVKDGRTLYKTTVKGLGYIEAYKKSSAFLNRDREGVG